jgi:hypothetical protein
MRVAAPYGRPTLRMASGSAHRGPLPVGRSLSISDERTTSLRQGDEPLVLPVSSAHFVAEVREGSGR